MDVTKCQNRKNQFLVACKTVNIKPNQDCEENFTREDEKSYSDDIPRESLQKMTVRLFPICQFIRSIKVQRSIGVPKLTLSSERKVLYVNS